MPPFYDPEDVRPMWEELVQVGFDSLTTPEALDAALKADGDKTMLLVVNSVCGCAAGSCRPGVALALQHETIPDKLVTVFAGVDVEATKRARDYMTEVQPSSPCIALFKHGRPVYVLERRHIEGTNAVELANKLVKVFDANCTRKGPSIPREEFEGMTYDDRCGSTIGLYPGN